MGTEIRVLLAEDSPTVRYHLTQLITSVPDMAVVGEARNGAEAINLVQELRPDVISMDINMPEVDGLQATRHIMEIMPTPIVVVSGLLEKDVELSLQAIEAGALAVIDKPPAQQHPSFAYKQEQIIKLLRAMAGVKVISRRKLRYPINNDLNGNSRKWTKTFPPEIIVIGASTGGPTAILQLLKSLPHPLKVPMLIVQHMPDEFIAGLATWLTSSTNHQVFVAKQGMVLQPEMVLLAPGSANLTVKRVNDKLVTQLNQSPTHARYIPSIDVLFHSVAKEVGGRAVGIIMTGMGDDGADGLLALRNEGAVTIVQDEASSIIFGMPRAAIERGAAKSIVSLPNLSSEIKKLL